MTTQDPALLIEIDGIRKAAHNLTETAQLAHYVYDRCSAYVGADHQGWSEALITAAIEAARVKELRATIWRESSGAPPPTERA